MVKKQYLCSGFKNRHNLFCTLKNQTDYYRGKIAVVRRLFSLYGIMERGEAIPYKRRQNHGFFA